MKFNFSDIYTVAFTHFKKLRFIDLLGIGVFFAILATMALFFLRKASYVYVVLRVSNDESLHSFYGHTPDWYINKLQERPEEKSVFGRLEQRVEDVYYYPSADQVNTVFVVMKVSTTYNQRSGQYTFQGVPLLVGKSQSFRIRELSVEGIIHDIYPQESEMRERVPLIVNAKAMIQYNEVIPYPGGIHFEGLLKIVSERLSPGMQVVRSDGQPYIEVLEVRRTPAFKEFVTTNGLRQVVDSERENVEMTLRVWAQPTNEKYLVREQEPLFIGGGLEMYFEEFRVGTLVQSIEPDAQNHSQE